MEIYTKRRFIAVGELVADCYYKNENGQKKLVKVDGGASRFNVIANLASRGYKTKVFSSCGSDIPGDIMLYYMNKLGIDLSDVTRTNDKTLRYHIIPTKYSSHRCEKTCPICQEKTWHEQTLENYEKCISKIQRRDVVILDSINSENAELIFNTINDKILDLGRIKKLIPLTSKAILEFLKEKIEILQLNELVEKYLLAKFEVESLEEIYEILQPNLLVVTRGKAGTDFVYKKHIYSKVLKKPAIEIDDTGAGDAFLSVVIQEYYNNNKKIDQQFVDNTFKIATKVTTQAVSHLGARGHLYDGYYPKGIYNCMCKR